LNKLKEKEIISEIKKGNRQVFESLFREYYSALCAYSKLVVKRNDIAEDIVQELFYKIWNKKNSLNITTSLKSYIYRSVYNNSIDYIRTEKHEIIYKEYNLHKLKGNKILQPDNDLIEKINKAIDELPEKQREVYKLKKFDNFSYEEIAKKLNISLKTVETHIRRANIALKQKMKNLSIIKILYILINIM